MQAKTYYARKKGQRRGSTVKILTTKERAAFLTYLHPRAEVKEATREEMQDTMWIDRILKEGSK